MSCLSLVSVLHRLSLRSSTLQNIVGKQLSTSSILQFNTTLCLMAEPLKRKKKMDPAVIRAREERKKKKLEKQIRRLEKNARQLKPIEECDVPLELLDQRSKIERHPVQLSANVLEERALLEKKWAKYKRDQHLQDVQMLDRIMYSQQKALDELRKVSEDLYQEAVQVDHALLPFETKGPVETPPIENYSTPDGDYTDISKKWD